MRNSIECFAEIKWQYPYKVCAPIQPFQPIMLGLHKRHCGLRIFFVGELNRSYEWRSLKTSDSSNLSISFSKSLVKIFVKEMGRSWLQFVKGDSLGMGVKLASFQDTHCSCNERLNSFVITGARSLCCKSSFRRSLTFLKDTYLLSGLADWLETMTERWSDRNRLLRGLSLHSWKV